MVTPVNLTHSIGECLYPVVFILKFRKKVLCGTLRVHLGAVFREPARKKESIVHEGHLMPDHVQIPPKYNVANVVGYLKGKSAIWIARNWFGKVRNFGGEHFWTRGTT